MAKHPVPKYKTPKTRTRTRHSAFVKKTVKKLEGIIAGSKHTFKKAAPLLKDKKQKKELEKINKVKA